MNHLPFVPSDALIKPPPGSSVAVALSGGVDSSVAAALAVEMGYKVVAVTLQLVDCENATGVKVCCGAEAIGAARKVCRTLGIEHKVIDCRVPFKDLILKYSLDEYLAGRTPNPCVMCNSLIKFGVLFDEAKKLGASYVATGHHTRVAWADQLNANGLQVPFSAGREQNASSDKHIVSGEEHNASVSSGRYPVLIKGEDKRKDQSYFLFHLNYAQLEKSWFPVGDYSKEQVRELARKFSLPTAERIESTDACFMQEGYTFAQSLIKQFGESPRPGEIVTRKGKTLGTHEGLHNFTIGQRRNLGVNTGYRVWVEKIDSQSRQVILTEDEDTLRTHVVKAERPLWTGRPEGFRRRCRSGHM